MGRVGEHLGGARAVGSVLFIIPLPGEPISLVVR